VLQAVIAAELDLISSYKSAVSASSNPLLPALLSQHQQHLVQLKSRLIVPAGASPSPSPSPSASLSSSPPSVATLRDAERASAASLTGQLVSVGPALAQLFASIAASDATHADALGGD
jgi:hypothetical protein